MSVDREQRMAEITREIRLGDYRVDPGWWLTRLSAGSASWPRSRPIWLRQDDSPAWHRRVVGGKRSKPVLKAASGWLASVKTTVPVPRR